MAKFFRTYRTKVLPSLQGTAAVATISTALWAALGWPVILGLASGVWAYVTYGFADGGLPVALVSLVVFTCVYLTLLAKRINSQPKLKLVQPSLKDMWDKKQEEIGWDLALVGSEYDGFVTQNADGESVIQFDLRNVTPGRMTGVEVMIDGGGSVQGFRLPLDRSIPKIYLKNDRGVDYVNVGDSERYTLLSRNDETLATTWGGRGGNPLDRPDGRWFVAVTILSEGRPTKRFKIFVLTQSEARPMHAVYMGGGDV